MTYIEAVGYTMLGASVTVFSSLCFERNVTQFFKSLVRLIPGQSVKKRPKFNANLRKVVRFYRRYGYWGLMILTPVLIGLPIGTWLAVRLGSPKYKVAVTVLVMAFFWSTLSYLIALNGLEQLFS